MFFERFLEGFIPTAFMNADKRAHTVHFPADVCFSTTFSKKCANVLKDVCTNLQFVQASLRTFAQFIFNIIFCVFANFWIARKKGLNLLVGFSWRLGCCGC